MWRLAFGIFFAGAMLWLFRIVFAVSAGAVASIDRERLRTFGYLTFIGFLLLIFGIFG